jgi:uncharacterized protein
LQKIADTIVFSATDLNNALACAHLTTLNLAALNGRIEKPTQRPAEAELLARLGEEHERRYLATLTAEFGQAVVTIDRSDGVEAAARATEDAMERGASIIYQAAFFDGIWIGYADFLRRIDAPGGRWPWRYEVEDTKLARQTEPYFLLQLCYYSEHVARIQGVDPESMYVVLGDGTRHAFRVAEFSAYYRRVKEQFLAGLAAQAETYPDPTPQCSRCVWDPICEARRAADDHLSAVANISRLQIGRLKASGITTLRALASASPDDPPPKMAPRTFVTLQRQARLQDEQRVAIARGEPNPYRYELLAESVHENRGFHRLPEPSPGDVFFDMEGDPYYEIGTGLEYLFGAVTADDGQFHSFWGCDRSERPVNDRLAEKRAFEAFIDFVNERRARFPAMHVYHYASYEKTALSKLALRHATREDEVDDLLREDVLVDLYAVVKQSIVVGQPGYSIKKIEDFYGKRGGESGITGGGESILRFDEWLTRRTDPASRDDEILADLERYNRYDCESTLGLRDWLLSLRLEAQRQFSTDVPWFAGKPPPDETPQRGDRFEAVIAALVAHIPPDYDPAASGDEDPVRPYFLVRHMLAYHAREDKPVWWAFHERSATYHDDPHQLLDDTETIVGLVPCGPPVPRKKSMLHTFRFPQQIHKIGVGDDVFDPATKDKVGDVFTLTEDDEGHSITVLRGPTRADAPLPDALTLRDLARRQPVIDAIARFAGALVEGRGSRYAAAYDVLTRGLPRVGGRAHGAALQPDTVNEATIGAVVDALDDSYLFIQGPPGSGKTTLAAGLITGLLGRGCTVGVTANSHASIHHLLGAIERETLERGVRLAGQKRCTAGNPESEYASETRRIDNVRDFALGDVNLVAGTAWAFGRDHMDGKLDYLFIDEAGQLALPLAISVMTAARNIVLLGDPRQLAQVSNTAHPGDIGASVLDHVLGRDVATVPPERGILLRDSYRMHPDVCRFISDTMYDGRLRSAPGRERQSVESNGLRGTGLRVVPVEHVGNAQESVAEAEAVADRIAMLLSGTVTAVDGEVRPLVPSDVIVVAPYNAQVHCLRKTLRERGLAAVQVGTVDKFQGREAYVVFFSTAASSAEEAARGARFIFDRQRLNVAVSRARALAVMVCSPALLDLTCSSIEDVRIANGVCRFLELAPAAQREAMVAG